MSSTPAFVATPNNAAVNIASANTSIDGTGAITALIQGAATGTRVLEIDAQIAVTGASTASLIDIFISTDSGTTWRLFDQITLAAATGSASVKSTRNIATYANLILKDATNRLGVTNTIAQSTNVVALAADL